MRLIHRSPRAANAVRTVSPSGELFVVSIMVCLSLASFGDAVNPTWIGEAGIELAFFDLAGEFTVLAMRHWHLLELLLAGSMMAVGIMVLRNVSGAFFRPLDCAVPGGVEKVPIQL